MGPTKERSGLASLCSIINSAITREEGYGISSLHNVVRWETDSYQRENSSQADMGVPPHLVQSVLWEAGGLPALSPAWGGVQS